MTLLQQLDELLDTMDHNLERGVPLEAAQDALDIVQHLQRISNSGDAMDNAHARMTILWLFGDEGRQMRKDQSGS